MTKPKTLEPVSYTHLDVYKRQPYGFNSEPGQHSSGISEHQSKRSWKPERMLL